MSSIKHDAATRPPRVPHNKKRGAAKKRTYRIWFDMRRRCQNTKLPHYALYGGRGIQVCERWQDFHNFYADMGDAPDGLTLERIDNDGNYEPSNCKWATWREQFNNKRTTKRITINGVTKPLQYWLKETGITRASYYERVKSGMTCAQAIMTPFIPHKERKRGKK